jgi:benzoyl-CoA reductase/2-hydroxyglutaryl-CoA dehydratase subunit BcrC/BadD/HgdB
MENQISAKELSDALMKDYIAKAFNARSEGLKVAYLTAISPVELLVAHDIVPVYPENHSVTCLVKHLGATMGETIERLGYDSHLCSYSRCDLAYRETGESPSGGVPAPDFLLACNTQCFTLTKWFEVLSRSCDVPLFVFDTPQWIFGNHVRKQILDYGQEQLRELIVRLEKLTGRKFDYDRLRSVMKYSAEASRLYKEFLDLAAYHPSPISIFDALIHMVIIVCMRGTQSAVHFYQTLVDEIRRERVANGIGVIPEERFRLYWENLPVWFKLRDHFKFFESHRANILTSLYVHAWVFDFDLSGDPLITLAENYTRRFSNVTIEERAEMALELFRRYQLNGSIMFLNRSCKGVSFAIHELRDIIVKRTNLPVLVFESDMGDQRFYSETQVRNRFEGYLETLERNYQAQ